MSLTLVFAWVALPIFAVVVLGVRYLVGREHRALLELARRFACTSCGAVLGEQGVALADSLWERHVQRIFEQKKANQRIVRNLDAACPKCGARYQHDPERSTFSAVEISLSFE
jgi:predicted RNA-binding Zn-ribbon protein involved in translation (DUF1610 family)